MSRDHIVHGTPVRFDNPVWEPLLELVGDYLINDFMWMCAIDLDDGSVIHAYKHSVTRHYVYVGEAEARTFEWDGEDGYFLVDPRDAIEVVFRDWDYLVVDPADREEIRAALHTARERAGDRFEAAIEEA